MAVLTFISKPSLFLFSCPYAIFRWCLGLYQVSRFGVEEGACESAGSVGIRYGNLVGARAGK